MTSQHDQQHDHAHNIRNGLTRGAFKLTIKNPPFWDYLGKKQHTFISKEGELLSDFMLRVVKSLDKNHNTAYSSIGVGMYLSADINEWLHEVLPMFDDLTIEL